MNNLTNIENMSLTELQAQSALLLNEQIKRLIDEVQKVKDATSKTEARQEIIEDKLGHIERKQAAQERMSINALRATNKNYDGWVNLTNFGLMLNANISRNRVGKLLKVVGIAQRNTGRTVPRREYVGDGRLCDTRITRNGSPQILWNFNRCMTYIELWLEKHGYLEKFYEKENGDELTAFIDYLYDKHVVAGSDKKQGNKPSITNIRLA